MDSHSTQRLPPCSSAATGCPQWMVLRPYGGGIAEDCNITGDPRTIAAAVTSSGHRISVSLRREPSSPVMSRICLCFLPGTANSQSAYSTVIAAHGGSVLMHITSTEGYLKPYAFNYFVYNNAGAADPARPPSLHLLPWALPKLDINATGMLCHGEAEFVVAQLKIRGSKDDAAAASPISFELLLCRYGEWCVMRPQIIGGDLLLGVWEPKTVVPLGNGLLCWCLVDRYLDRGVIFSDVLQESPELRYVPYPAELVNDYGFRICTNARGALKLVRLSPLRCSHCGCSEHATAVDTWTLKTDDMAWILETETMVDSTELGALDFYILGYARYHLVYPVASMSVGGHHAVLDESAAPTDEQEDEAMSTRQATRGMYVSE